MRINSIPPKELYGQYVANKTKKMQTVKSTADQLELTDTAKTFSATLSAAKKAMGQDDTARADRVKEVKQQVDAGTYSIPGQLVAERILNR